MIEECEKRDRQWSELLTRCHGEVEVDAGFKAGLLQKLKARTAENGIQDTPQAESEEDRNFRTLLTAAYVPCEPDVAFKAGLLGKLKEKNLQVDRRSEGESEDDAVRTILSSSYTPVAPRKEFQTRLLENLKERQRNTTIIRRTSRRRTLFFSSVSSMAAAAVLFVVWSVPFGVDADVPQTSAMPTTVAMLDQIPLPSEENYIASESAYAGSIVPASYEPALANAGQYRVDDVFGGAVLPATVRGEGMEVNYGDGWQIMDNSVIATIKPGMSFRPAKTATRATGLGFGDGSTILLCNDSRIVATENGITVDKGTMSITVPQNSGERFRLHFAERDIAIEPGTMLAVSVKGGNEYADGGDPAPIIRVADGGMAIARGKSGSGPLLANRAYRLYNYVTADLPSRPLGAAECEELDKTLRQVNPASFASGGAAQPTMLASSATFSRAEPAPEGFVKRGSRWYADTYKNEATIRVQYLSDDYFGFASSRRDLANALALGSEVTIDGGDGSFYEIYK